MTDPRLMKQYLGYAMRMEQTAYALRRSLSRVTAVYEKMDRALATSSWKYENSMEGLDTLSVHEYTQIRKKTSSRVLKKTGIALGVFLALLVLSIVFLIAAAATDKESLAMVSIVFILPIVLFTPAVVIVGLVFLYQLFRYTHAKREAKQAYAEEKIQLIRSRDLHGQEVVDYTRKRDAYLKTKKQISEELATAQKNLQELYDQNLLPKVYRNLVAVSTLYGYLETGRCITVEGHGGIYDTYENEIRLNLIITKLQDISDKLDQIRENQHDLYMAVERGNQMAENIYRETERIAASSEVTAANSALIAVHQQQINDHLAYMRYWS